MAGTSATEIYHSGRGRITGAQPGKVVGIFGHYGNENLGDEAIITAVLQQIERWAPSTKTVCLSINPRDTHERYGVEAFPIRQSAAGSNTRDSAGSETALIATNSNQNLPRPSRMYELAETIKDIIKKVRPFFIVAKFVSNALSWLRLLAKELVFIKNSYKIAKGIDLFVVCGSNQFLDNFGGPWAFPYTLLKWAVLAKLAGKKIIYVSVGAGPIYSRLSKILIRFSLLFSSYTSFRDVASKQLIEEGRLRADSFVYPDLAFSLDMDQIKSAEPNEAGHNGLPVIAINPMAVYDARYWYIVDDDKYRNYVTKMAEFSKRLLDEGYPIFFFATQPKDENAIEDLLHILAKKHGLDMQDLRRYVQHSYSVYELMKMLRSADLVVATRFHGTVLSLLAERPVLGVCYYRKAMDLLQDMGQSDYALDLDDFTVDELLLRFRMLEEKRAEETRKIIKSNREYRCRLQEQYERIAPFMQEAVTCPHPGRQSPQVQGQ